MDPEDDGTGKRGVERSRDTGKRRCSGIHYRKCHLHSRREGSSSHEKGTSAPQICQTSNGVHSSIHQIDSGEIRIRCLNQRRTDQCGNIGRAPYLKSGDDDGAEGRPGHVEEERLWPGDGRPGRRRLTPGRTAGEGSGEREDGGGRRLRSDGQQRDARVGFGMNCRIGEGEWRWRAGQIGKGKPALVSEAEAPMRL
jgi:hypothetical protein